jgi:hypothetical protein
MSNIELLYVIPITLIVFFFMSVIGVTLISVIIGDIGMGETMLKILFREKNNRKL